MADKAILVIDSDSETAQKIESALESQDYLVFIASTEEFGMTMARKVHPALIFVNPAMTGGSGLNICTKIHGIDPLSDIPIIILTPPESELDARYLSEYGIVDAIGKAFTQEELLEKTSRVLSLKPSHEAPLAGERPGFKRQEEVQLLKKGNAPASAEDIFQEATDVPAGLPEDSEVEMGKKEPPSVARIATRSRRDSGGRLTIPLIATALAVMIAGSGFFLYKTGLFGTKTIKKPAVVEPIAPDQLKPAQQASEPTQKLVEGTSSGKNVEGTPQQVTSASATAVKEPQQKPTRKAFYAVQIGAFKDERNAETLVELYKKKGYDAFVQTVPKDREMFHRVLIGKFDNRKAAWTMATDIMKKENIKVVVTGD